MKYLIALCPRDARTFIGLVFALDMLALSAAIFAGAYAFGTLGAMLVPIVLVAFLGSFEKKVKAEEGVARNEPKKAQ